MIFIGIDPGSSGGIAVIHSIGVRLSPMPRTERDIFDVIAQEEVRPAFALIEKVQGYAGVPGTTGTSMFKFGMNYGLLRMALTAAGIPFEDVLPRAWQAGLSIPIRKKEESRTEWKNRLKAKAQQLFPSVKGITLATCDALLIAEFCRRRRADMKRGRYAVRRGA
jgi:hypothetical protein